MTEKRKSQLFDQMLQWICESINNEEDLFLTLHRHLGMTLEELHEHDIENLDALFAKEITPSIPNQDNAFHLNLLKHRSFLVEIEPGCGPDAIESLSTPCDGYYCRIYADADLDRDYMIDSFPVVVSEDIPTASDTLLYDFIRHHIDADLMNFLMERSDRMEKILTDKLGLAACLLRENRTDEELYDTLRERIGLSDEGIRAIGFTSLVPFFDRKEYANNIALWLMDEGTISNEPMDYRISFDTVNERYGVQLPGDRELLDEIIKHLNPDVVDEVKIDNGFQISFNEHACPYENPDVSFDFSM